MSAVRSDGGKSCEDKKHRCIRGVGGEGLVREEAREDLSEEVKLKNRGQHRIGSQCARHSEQWTQTFQGRAIVGKLEGQKARVGWEWGEVKTETGPEVKTCGALGRGPPESFE